MILLALIPEPKALNIKAKSIGKKAPLIKILQTFAK